MEIERFDEEIEPVLAERVHVLAGYTIAPPETAGVVQLATARVGGREWLRFELSLHVAPEAVGWETRDRIRIDGENELDVIMKPGMPAVSTTAALLVNAVPAVLAARPGSTRRGGCYPIRLAGCACAVSFDVARRLLTQVGRRSGSCSGWGLASCLGG